MADLSEWQWLLAILPLASFAFTIYLYVKKDSFKRGETDASLESKNLLTSTLLTNAIKQLESQSEKIDKVTDAQHRLNDEIIEDLHSIKTEQAVMREKFKSLQGRFGPDVEQDDDDNNRFEANRRR